MKNIILFLIFIFILLESCSTHSQIKMYKYQIEKNVNEKYYFNKYKVKDSCIIFNGLYLDGITIKRSRYFLKGDFRLCDYYVIKNNDYYIKKKTLH